MRRWRLVVAVALAAFIAAPLLLPTTKLFTDPDGRPIGADVPRIVSLSQTTSLLVAGTLALCLPTGVVAAVFLYRTDLPFRHTLRALVVLTLFIPLPLFTSGWQAAVGSGGWLPLRWWNAERPPDAVFSSDGNVWTPWGQGIGTAIWIHAVAGLPWIVWLVGRGLRQVDRELEEDALTTTSAWRVVLLVSLPRASAWIAGAALWVALQTATEITVTDVMQVRTYAEEIYTQFVLSDRGALARTVIVSLPLTLLVIGIVLVAVRRWEQTLPSSLMRLTQPKTFHLRSWRWPAGLAIAAAAVFLIAIPVGSLIWRAGLAGSPLSWSAGETVRNLRQAVGSSSSTLWNSVVVAFGSGLVAATLALVACWSASESRGFRTAVFILVAAAWAMPGPVVGLGLLALIDGLLNATGQGIIADVLWYGPSPVPVMWADVIRFFPCAVAVLWPALRMLPTELREAARVEGAGPLREFVAVVVPLTAGMWLLAALTAGVLSLGEVSGSKIVSTPGGETWSHLVFAQMHYGVTSDLAARCLLLLLVVVAGTCAIGAVRVLPRVIAAARVSFSAQRLPSRS